MWTSAQCRVQSAEPVRLSICPLHFALSILHYSPCTVMDPSAEIRKLYYAATRATIVRDVERAIALLKTLPTEEERERVAVYMDGLSQMRSDWVSAGPRRPAGAPPAGAARGRSDRSKSTGRRESSGD